MAEFDRSKLEQRRLERSRGGDSSGKTTFDPAKLEERRKARQQPAPSSTMPETASMADVALGSPLGRLGLGAASLLTGPFQLGANVGSALSGLVGGETTGPLSGEWVNRKMRELEEAKQRGMKFSGREGYDFAGLLGAIGAGGAGLANLPRATTPLAKILQGAKIGTAFGAASPVISKDSFWPEKGWQTAAGLATGTAIPLVTEGGRAIGRGVRNIYDLVKPGREGKILTRYQRDITGAAQLPAVRDKLRAAEEIVPGSKPTAAQALAGLPEGSPLTAHQAIVASKPGGPSAAFGERLMRQKEAREAFLSRIAKTPQAIKSAVKERDIITGPMREEALAAANQSAWRKPLSVARNLKPRYIMSNIQRIANQPGLRANDLITKTLQATKDKIASLPTNKQGSIDARDLYMVRQTIGNTIKKYADETKTFDQRLIAGLQNDVQGYIDNAIESAGGTGWKLYLSKYADLSKSISQMRIAQELKNKLISPTGTETPGAYLRALRDSAQMLKRSTGVPRYSDIGEVFTPAQEQAARSVAADLERELSSLRPIQRTHLPGGSNVTELETGHLPQMLSRPMMVANWITRLLGQEAEPRLNMEATRRYMYPQNLAKILEDVPPSLRHRVLQGMIEGATAGVPIATSREIGRASQ